MRNHCRRWVGVLLLQLAATAAFADISLRLTNQQLTEQSDLILIGRTSGSASRWIDRTLVTAVTVQVTEVVKGFASGQIEVILPGGIDANRAVPIAMTYPGAPRMQPDEEMFLFLSYDTDIPGYVVTGFAQGKFSIVTQQGTRMISRDLRGSQLVEGTGIARGSTTLTPLVEFRAEIAGYLNR